MIDKVKKYFLPALTAATATYCGYKSYQISSFEDKINVQQIQLKKNKKKLDSLHKKLDLQFEYTNLLERKLEVQSKKIEITTNYYKSHIEKNTVKTNNLLSVIQQNSSIGDFKHYSNIIELEK